MDEGMEEWIGKKIDGWLDEGVNGEMDGPKQEIWRNTESCRPQL